MFDGMPAEQLHQFIAAASASSPSSSLLLHHGASSFSSFMDPLFNTTTTTSSSSSQHQQEMHFLHPLMLQQQKSNNEEIRPHIIQKDPVWSHDEVLALLRIRSGLENWFPELTWEHVSRRLGEDGYKRTAEKCKEKFEEESRNFSNISYNNNKSYRAFNFNELVDPADDHQELFHHHHHHHHHHQGQNDHHHDDDGDDDKVADEEPNNEKMDQQDKTQEQNVEGDGQDPRNDHDHDHQTVTNKSPDHQEKEKTLSRLIDDNDKKKRKRMRYLRESKEFEKLKCFCEDVVKKMMAQQEEMHKKFLQDMVKRDEEKLAREEAWKKQEMERINKELEVRASQQAIASDRQATIINFLNKFSSSSSTSSSSDHHRQQDTGASHHQNPNPTLINTSLSQNPSSNLPTSAPALSLPPAPQNPSDQNKPSLAQETSHQTLGASKLEHDIGKRWPRDEVLALVNMRCKLYNNGDDQVVDREGGGGARVPLWERISQGMLELGYKRSAKRCKEKWENINKYFRKTKDSNTSKKRSLDSRTCPYFHQLSTLYENNQAAGTINTLDAAPPPLPPPPFSNGEPENNPVAANRHGGNSSSESTVMHVADHQVGVSQAFDFEF